jgi:tRNA modification GTPase
MIAASSQDSDTIVARATPPGRGGVAVLRVSGPRVRAIGAAILGELPPPRHAALGGFRDADGNALDQGLALYFPAPHSFTGEDVLELHTHGGPVVCDMVCERVVQLGARIAQPGEFSRRAFLNDKLDLNQAEAIADLIDSGSRAAARAAHRSLQGRFSAAVVALTESVTGLRTWVEAAIDFPDEDIDFLAAGELHQRLDAVMVEFDQLESTVRQGVLLRDGVDVVLAGRPNAGKSSLLNALAGYEAAIVTELPGTTRDLVREQLDLDGLPVRIVDTAGLRPDPDRVEAEGIRRARAQLASADHALLVVDASTDAEAAAAELAAELPPDIGYTVVGNKVDLTGEPAGPAGHLPNWVNVSAKTGAGLEALREHLKARLGFEDPGEGTVIARQRHLDALRRARTHFEAARRQLVERQAGELMAEELREVQHALAEITGEFGSEDLLARIFASFCIGK